jgi:protein-disulfide isomerase
VTVVEYADYQCPACASFVTSQVYQQLNAEYIETGQVQYIFHDFPLPQHPNAPVASHAAYCAGEQDSFWPMHEQIFRNQQQWSRLPEDNAQSVLAQLAGDIGLNGTEFLACMNSDKYDQHIASAYDRAATQGIPATPTFVVNGRQVNATELLPAIDQALNAGS